jgi:hypothetical protein
MIIKGFPSEEYRAFSTYEGWLPSKFNIALCNLKLSHYPISVYSAV